MKAYHTSRGPIEANLEATYYSSHLQIDFSPFHNQGTRISLSVGIKCGAEMGLSISNQGTLRYQNCLDLLQSCSLHIHIRGMGSVVGCVLVQLVIGSYHGTFGNLLPYFASYIRQVG